MSDTTDAEIDRIRKVFEKHTMPAAGDPELTMFDTDAIIEELQELVRAEVAKARIDDRIEHLDIQCGEGNCTNCDGKRPMLKKLKAEKAALSSNQKEETE